MRYFWRSRGEGKVGCSSCMARSGMQMELLVGCCVLSLGGLVQIASAKINALHPYDARTRLQRRGGLLHHHQPSRSYYPALRTGRRIESRLGMIARLFLRAPRGEPLPERAYAFNDALLTRQTAPEGTNLPNINCR